MEIHTANLDTEEKQDIKFTWMKFCWCVGVGEFLINA